MIRHKVPKSFIATALALALSACGAGRIVPNTTGTTVTASGGTVTGPDGVQVVIPAGALSADTAITIRKNTADTPPTPESLSVGAGGDVYEITPHNVVFKEPVTIKLPVPAGLSEPVVYAAETGTGWYPHKATVKDGFVEIKRTGFSYYQIVGSGGIQTSYFLYTATTGIKTNQADSDYSASINSNFEITSYESTKGTWVLGQNVPASVNFSAFQEQVGGGIRDSLICNTAELGSRLRLGGAVNADRTPAWQDLPTVPMTVQPRLFGPRHVVNLNYTPTVLGDGEFYFYLSCNGEKNVHASRGIKVNFTVKPTQSVKGTVTGLPQGLTVGLTNAGNTVTVGSGNFAFNGLLKDDTYNVQVQTGSLPANANCTVQNGSGTINDADVTNVTVNCTAPAYSVKGSVTGLPNSSTLNLTNAGNTVTVGNGGFEFNNLGNGFAFNVGVAADSLPAKYTCEVSNGSGTISGADVTNVTVTCSKPEHSVGGTVSGLTGSALDRAQLQLNGGESFYGLNGSFAFSTKLEPGMAYTVSIPSQGTSECKITGGTGTIAADGLSITGTMGNANITDIVATCTQTVGSGPFTVSGTVSGLMPGYSMTVSMGSEAINVTDANPNFTFTTKVNAGASYTVEASNATASDPQAPVLTCMGGGGTANADVTVAVNCMPVGGP